jgi:meso-butanediol dehydrogenase / (S,S)-butanediol dehydrogenase / diacetyl reductase
VKLEDRIAVVTGAASGIGEATAQLFAAEGAVPVLVDVDEGGLESCSARIARRGGDSLVHRADVSDSAEVTQLFAHVRERFGRVDILFNNAGIAVLGTVVTTPEELWDRTLAVNLKSVYLCCREAIPLMTRGGSIINTASSWGPIAANNVAAYCASKAGVVNLTRSIAIDFAPDGIRANCLVPGTTDTPMVRALLAQQPDPERAAAFYERMQPIRRFASPEEIARAVVFLASDDASYATGATFSIDGGYGAGRVAFEDEEGIRAPQ